MRLKVINRSSLSFQGSQALPTKAMSRGNLNIAGGDSDLTSVVQEEDEEEEEEEPQ